MPDTSVPSPDPTPGTGTGAAGSGPAAPGSAAAPAAGRRSVIDAGADLLQLVVDYLRQEAGDLVREKITLPVQKAGTAVAFALAAATVLVVGLLFLAVSGMMLLAGWVGWTAALAIIGAVFVLGAGGLSYAKVRSMQR